MDTVTKLVCGARELVRLVALVFYGLVVVWFWDVSSDPTFCRDHQPNPKQ